MHWTSDFRDQILHTCVMRLRHISKFGLSLHPPRYSIQVIGKQVPGNRPDVLAGEVKVLQLVSRAARPSSGLLKLLDVYEVR